MTFSRPGHVLSRRNLLKLGALFFDPLSPWPVQAATSAKRVLVAGAGLAGLSCAWELTKRGHDVTVLEASNRTGGHVRTLTGGFPDDLYADCGAEHFTKPGYDLCYRYAEELGLTLLPYPHRNDQLVVWNGAMVKEAEANRSKLAAANFNDRERKFLARNPGATLSQLYLDRYATQIGDEYQPFGCGLDWLDDLSLTQLLQRDGASQDAIEEIGSSSSALHIIWKRRIVQMRGIPEEPTMFYRVRGGNQGLPNALAARLGTRVAKNTAVTAIRWDNEGVVVTLRKEGQTKTMSGDYLVCCMNAAMLRQIPATPAWPEPKQWAIANVPYTVETRPIFQSRSKFWKGDGFSGNMQFGSPILGPLWPTASEVHTDRGIMIGTGQASVTSEAALKVFHRYYPGRAPDFEKTLVVDWSRDPWAMGCEARDYKPGELHKFWPAVIAPAGRVHFAGAYCDNQSWGMEAATRSGFRVARAIHEGLTA